MKKIEKIQIQDSQKKSPYLETYLMGVYDGNISKDDEIFVKMLHLFKKKCGEIGIDYDIDINLVFNMLFTSMLEKVKEENGVDISFSNLDDFEDEFIEYMNNVNELPMSKRVVAIDSVVNMDYMHNPTASILAIAREYIASRLESFYSGVERLFNAAVYEDSLKWQFDPFAASSERSVSEEEKRFYESELEFLLLLPKFSKLFETRRKYINQVLEMRDAILLDGMRMEYPEYMQRLQDLVNHKEQDVSYYYHGAPSQAIAQKTLDEGLYMQYGEIERTAKRELSVSEILEYSYGHDGVGRHAVVVIAVPNGENPIEKNDNPDIKICGTSQGKEQGEFTPEYVIPRQYLLGYIDKDAKQFIANLNYSRDGQGINGRRA